MAEFEQPRWQRDLRRFLSLKPQFVLSGNVRDLQLTAAGATVAALPLTIVLTESLRVAGFTRVVAYEPVTGFKMLLRPGEDAKAGAAFLERLGLTPGTGGCAPAGMDFFAETLDRIVTFAEEPVALVVDFASRLVVRRDALTPIEHQAFTRAFMASHQARPPPHGEAHRAFFDTVVWIVEREGDLPDWLIVGNPRVRHVPVSRPDHRIRRQLAASLLRPFDGFTAAPFADADAALDDFAGQTEGMLLIDLAAVAQLARGEGLGYAAIGDAVRRYIVSSAIAGIGQVQ